MNARIGRSQSGITDLCLVELRPWIALEGLLLEESELELSEAVLELNDQRAWSAWSAYEGEVSAANGKLKDFGYTEPETLRAELAGGDGQVLIEDASIPRPDLGDWLFKSRCEFRIRLNQPLPVRDFMRLHVRPLEVMIAAATGRLQSIKSMRATNSEWRIAGERDSSDRWVTVRFGGGPPASDRTLNAHDFLFRLSDIEWSTHAPQLFETVLSWEYVVEQWSMLLHPQYQWPLARFISAVNAVESLDRRLHDEEAYDVGTDAFAQEVLSALSVAGFNSYKRRKVRHAFQQQGLLRFSLEQRLRRVAKGVTPVMEHLVEGEDWAKRVANLRHVVSHGLSSSRLLVGDHRPVQVGTEILIHLLEATLLKTLGFTNQQVDQLQARRVSFGWRVEMIRESLHVLPTRSGG